MRFFNHFRICAHCHRTPRSFSSGIWPGAPGDDGDQRVSVWILVQSDAEIPAEFQTMRCSYHRNGLFEALHGLGRLWDGYSHLAYASPHCYVLAWDFHTDATARVYEDWMREALALLPDR